MQQLVKIYPEISTAFPNGLVERFYFKGFSTCMDVFHQTNPMVGMNDAFSTRLNSYYKVTLYLAGIVGVSD